MQSIDFDALGQGQAVFVVLHKIGFRLDQAPVFFTVDAVLPCHAPPGQQAGKEGRFFVWPFLSDDLVNETECGVVGKLRQLFFGTTEGNDVAGIAATPDHGEIQVTGTQPKRAIELCTSLETLTLHLVQAIPVKADEEVGAEGGHWGQVQLS